LKAKEEWDKRVKVLKTTQEIKELPK